MPTSSDEATLSIESTPSLSSNEDEALLAALGNRALRGNEISGNFDSRNVIQGSRTRRSAYVAALGQTDKLIGYYASFNTAVKAGGITKFELEQQNDCIDSVSVLVFRGIPFSWGIRLALSFRPKNGPNFPATELPIYLTLKSTT